jgi:hypothetical protein
MVFQEKLDMMCHIESWVNSPDSPPWRGRGWVNSESYIQFCATAMTIEKKAGEIKKIASSHGGATHNDGGYRNNKY